MQHPIPPFAVLSAIFAAVPVARSRARSLSSGRFWGKLICLLLLVGLPAGSVSAQWGGNRGDDRQTRGDRDRRDDNRRDWGRGEGRQESGEERRKRFIRSLDRNSDGVIDSSEMSDDRRGEYFKRLSEGAGLDTSKPIAIDKYMKARQKQDFQKKREANPTAFLNETTQEKVPGFGKPLTEEEVAIFYPDRPRASATTGGSAKNSGSSSRLDKRSDSSSDRTRNYARSLFEKYDKNNNHILERNEWERMRGNPERADKNRDGKISFDELVNRLSQRNDGNDKKDRQNRSSQKKNSRQDDKEEKLSYRFTSPLERLSEEAWKWVEEYDENSDGQVAMAEFSQRWTDSIIHEFQQYVLNSDGMVTGQEYLDSQEEEEEEE